MPFAAQRRHQYWTADVRYLDVVDEQRLLLDGKVYAISILENYSRAILASAVSQRQDLAAFLSVLYQAVERYGSPEALVTDGGSIFGANRAKAIYKALKIEKEEIQKGKPWQSYIETTFNIQRRMADFYFSRAESWQELVGVHSRWMEEYNHQAHWAHRERGDGRHSPLEVLGWVSGGGVRYQPEDLARVFFANRFSRKLDDLGYARFRHWRVYGEEGLAKKKATLWLGAESLSIEYAGETLSRYKVELEASTGRVQTIAQPILYESSYRREQLRLFELEESGWLKALKVSEYERKPRGTTPQVLQQVLFSYGEAL